MQITVSNLLASEALWATMTKLADRVVDGCICAQNGIAPYSVIHFKNDLDDSVTRRQRDVVEHLTINASNASFRVSRIIDVAEGTIKYNCQKGGYVGRAIRRHLELTQQSSVDAIQFFAGLINFIDTYRTKDGAQIREKLALAEAYSVLKNKARSTFYKHISDNATNVLSLRSFYRQGIDLSDLEQIADSGLPNVGSGVYVYPSLDGGGVADTLVIVTDTGSVAVIHLPKSGKFHLYTTSRQLGLMVDFLHGVGASLIDSLVDTNSFIHGLLNQVTVE
jgi:hypothetical protein